MKRLNFWLPLTVIFSLFLGSCAKETSITQPSVVDDIVVQKSEPIENSYIIVFNTKITSDMGKKYPNDYFAASSAVQQLARGIFAEYNIVQAEITQTYSKVLNAVAVNLTPAEIKRFSTDKRIKYIEQDQLVTLAPPPGKGPPGNGGGGGSEAQETPYGITRVKGVADYTGGSRVAWIIDSGVDLDHPDLNVDASRGFNAFTTGKDAGLPDDGNGHGTHVAGTIAAINNGFGVIGVAPGATVIPVKVLNSRGSGSYSGVIAGVEWVAIHGNDGDVANMSLGGSVSQALDDAVVAASEAKGVKFVLAAGNEADNANNHSPARANGTYVYTISAMNNNDMWASFSNYGNPPVDYCAPGVAIKSTWKNGGYNTISGTSMAAPHAAGVLLLGIARTEGNVTGDRDNNPDAIIVH